MVGFAERVLVMLNLLETDAVVLDFMNSMQSHGVIVNRNESFKREGSSLATYRITKLGVSIYANDGRFFTAHFHIQNPASEDGIQMLPYVYELPFGLPSSCCRADVRAILGIPMGPTITTKNLQYNSEPYQIGSFRIACFFPVEAEQLVGLHVMYYPQN